jgi:hypothetical protein
MSESREVPAENFLKDCMMDRGISGKPTKKLGVAMAAYIAAPPFPRCDLVNNAAVISGVLSMALTIDRKCGRRARPRVVS